MLTLQKGSYVNYIRSACKTIPALPAPLIKWCDRPVSKFIICSILFITPAVYASSIIEVSFPELCMNAELIFEGQVTSISAIQEPDTGNIWTQVSFDVIEKIKGPAIGGTLTLRFLGGTVGDLTLNVSDLKIPELNEHGIYFVESLSQNLENPLLGWSQGHYLIEMDNSGTARITTQDQEPVSEIEQTPTVSALVTSDAPAADAGSDETTLTEALTVSDFKTIIRQQLN